MSNNAVHKLTKILLQQDILVINLSQQCGKVRKITYLKGEAMQYDLSTTGGNSGFTCI